MYRHHCIGSVAILLPALLLSSACNDSATEGLLPTGIAAQFHEEEDPEFCDQKNVDCVSELNQPASYQASKNLRLMGFSPRTVPHGTAIFNSDLAFWGRTAYQGTYQGFRIIDISQPDNPVEIHDYTECVGGSTRGAQGDLVIWNNILVRTWDASASIGLTCGGRPVEPGFEGLHIFDVSSPTTPLLVASVDLLCGSHSAMGVPDPEHNRILIYSAPSSPLEMCRGLDIVEVPLSAPSSASYLRFESSGDPNGAAIARPCHDGAAILGAIKLLACAGGDGVTVWSLSDTDGASLENPGFLYSTSVFGVTIGHSAAFTWDGEVLVFGHEPGGGGAPRCQVTSSEADRSIFFFHARTGSPLGSFVMPRPQSNRENCTWHYYNVVPTDGRYILVSGNYQSGISVVDFTSPAAAREIAYADPPALVNPANPSTLVPGGDWSAYWYNGFIFESDMRRGLLVWRLNDPAVAGARKLDHLNPQTQETSSPLRGRG